MCTCAESGVDDLETDADVVQIHEAIAAAAAAARQLEPRFRAEVTPPDPADDEPLPRGKAWRLHGSVYSYLPRGTSEGIMVCISQQ